MKREDEIKLEKKKKTYPLSEKAKRVYRPKIDAKRCERCMLCVVLCPDNAIEARENNVTINYEKCKGCLICLRECPFRAISEDRE
jgi:2-oxoacid:acceptor oxidoreductase delta subunit (pyruvate/2-ketoisovalerate family)